MNYRNLITLIILTALFATASCAKEYDRKANVKAIENELKKMDKGIEDGPFKADWASLEAHKEAPEWFRDAKLGIYFHWGVYAVPAHGNEWYGRAMHVKSKKELPKEPYEQYTPSSYKYHVKTYGEPDEFGYHDFVPMFKAEHFDAEEWADLFVKAGAKFVGPVAEHHDGFSMWDSDITPWNAADMGPKRDIVGELEKSIRKRDLKFITTLHHDRTNHWYPRVEGWGPTSDDPKLQMLYMNIPDKLFYEIWQAKLGEVIDKYQPDLIWFDGRLNLIPNEYHKRFLAYYFNKAKEWGSDVVVTTKDNQYRKEVSVQDFEKGRLDHLADYSWLTDDTISRGSWCYTKNLKVKSPERVLHDFIDIVSKNGCLLLNISPMANGVIPDNQREVLLEIGNWLKLNGEAIYGTRPWLEYGEGPVKMKKSGAFSGKVNYSGKDIRYTRSKDNKNLYAVAMGWPKAEKMILAKVKVDGSSKGKVTLVGYDKELSYSLNDKKQPVIEVPDLSEDQLPCKYAYVFKLSGFETSLQLEKEEAYDPEKTKKAIEKELEKMDKVNAKGPFKPEWDSLKEHNEAPEWFRNAKLGIYFHWGVYSVPAYGNEWYPRNMHLKKGRKSYYQHHVKAWGEPDEFGYHDFVPMFKAQNFSPKNWVWLFKKAGAKFVGPVAEHHDGYSMWDSEMTPWNANDTGPGRDIVGELRNAVRKEGLKFITTLHHERSRNWYPRVDGWPTTSDDPKLQMLYFNVSEDYFNQIFQAKLGEVIDKYQPDLIWFDGQMSQIQEQSHLRFLAYYFNNAKKWNRDVVVTTKKRQYPQEISVQDFEKGRMDELTDYCWLTDDTISMGSWCYTQDLKIKPVWRVLHDFIDIVSKNGCLLLNVSPRADGVIPDDQEEVLLQLGEWLDLNGEAIYDTRPWLAYGQGPTKLRKSGSFVGHNIKYGPEDIRYTRSIDNKTLYAIVLGWPESSELNLSKIKVDGQKNSSVSLLGYEGAVGYNVNGKGQLVVDVPRLSEDQRPCKYAYVFKLTGFETSLQD